CRLRSPSRPGLAAAWQQPPSPRWRGEGPAGDERRRRRTAIPPKRPVASVRHPVEARRPTLEVAAAPHPYPLPVNWERGASASVSPPVQAPAELLPAAVPPVAAKAGPQPAASGPVAQAREFPGSRAGARPGKELPAVQAQ